MFVLFLWSTCHFPPCTGSRPLFQTLCPPRLCLWWCLCCYCCGCLLLMLLLLWSTTHTHRHSTSLPNSPPSPRASATLPLPSPSSCSTPKGKGRIVTSSSGGENSFPPFSLSISWGKTAGMLLEREEGREGREIQAYRGCLSQVSLPFHVNNVKFCFPLSSSFQLQNHKLSLL